MRGLVVGCIQRRLRSRDRCVAPCSIAEQAIGAIEKCERHKHSAYNPDDGADGDHGAAFRPANFVICSDAISAPIHLIRSASVAMP
jgi:hypothetical protein